MFRVDASSTIGHGHVMRCLTLGNALRERGAAVSYVCREHDGNLCDLIRRRGFDVEGLPAPQSVFRAEHSPSHAAWLGESWERDAAQTQSAIEARGTKADWLVADHYGIDYRWENALRSSAEHMMVIDDLADRAHDCDLLLDQNLVAGLETRYSNKASAACNVLLGPEYALLDSIYAEMHERRPPRAGAIRRIFVYFGGADNDNLTGRCLSALLKLNRPDIEVDVVITADSPTGAAVRELVAEHENVRLHGGLPTLAPLMAEADLAIGGAGATSWERLCLGLPALVVSLAENQRPIAEFLSERGVVHWIGHHDEVTESIFLMALGDHIREGVDEDWSHRCLEMVDGKGVNRVCAALIATSATPLRARRATLADERRLLGWANDPTTRGNSFSSATIGPESHGTWLRSRLCDPTCRLYIVETDDGVPVGQVRFDRGELAWGIDYTLVPHLRGRGLGRSLMRAALVALWENEPNARLHARVKQTNMASRRVFECLGFTPTTMGDVIEYRHEP